MTTQHTPGPWELRQSVRGYWFIDCEQGGESYTLTALECNEADARLMAAAPDLLAALQECVDYLDCIPEAAAGGCDDARKLVRIARAAIAKATGGAA
jgi:hypothetical protein